MKKMPIPPMQAADNRLFTDPNIFRLILDKAGEEFFLIRLDGSIAYANEAAAANLGYTIPELLSAGIPDIDPVFGPDFAIHVEALRENDLPPFETTHVRKDGQLLFKEIKSVLIKIDDEEYICAFARDISKRKGVEELLKKSEEKYRRLVENLRYEYFFYTHDTHGVFNYLSPSIINILGYSPKEFLSHYTEHLTDNPINRKAIQHTDLSIRGIKQPSYEVEIYHKDGSIRWLEVTEFPVLDNRGLVVAVEGIAHDVTEKKHVYEETERKSLELEEVNAAMKALLRQSAESKKELEDNVMANIRDLVIPHLEELEIHLPDVRKRLYCSVIKANLEQITSSFSRNLSLADPKMTPREIQIADLVRSGKTNKEIADLLGLSKRTVESYRDRLRHKLAIRNKKINLRTFLLSRT